MDRVKVALVGCGYWGKNLLRNFHDLGALGLVCDSSPANQAIARSMAPGIPIVDSFDEVLANEEISALVIATPAVTHYSLVRKALECGKDVFVEKPLALTYGQGRDLLRRKGDRILMVGHILEYHPACVRLIELVRQGELGELCYIYSNRLSLGKIRREENILWSFAPHDIGLINRIVGSLPLRVSASGGSYIQPFNPDVTVTNLEYPKGIRSHIHVSWLHPFKEQRLVVIGRDKMAVFDGVEDRLQLFDQRVEWREGEPVPVKADGVDIPFPTGEPLRLECEAFLSSIKSRLAPLTDGWNGLEVLSVLEAAQRSIESHGVSRPVEQVVREPEG